MKLAARELTPGNLILTFRLQDKGHRVMSLGLCMSCYRGLLCSGEMQAIVWRLRMQSGDKPQEQQAGMNAGNPEPFDAVVTLAITV